MLCYVSCEVAIASENQSRSKDFFYKNFWQLLIALLPLSKSDTLNPNYDFFSVKKVNRFFSKKCISLTWEVISKLVEFVTSANVGNSILSQIAQFVSLEQMGQVFSKNWDRKHKNRTHFEQNLELLLNWETLFLPTRILMQKIL